MPDYQQGKIYKITYGDEAYYGSTAMTLKERMYAHKSNYNRWKDGTGRKCVCYELFDKYGFDNCPIELVEDYSCKTKTDLLMREDWYMDNNECINKNAAYQTKEEYLEQKLQYRQDHRQEAIDKSRQWHQDHKEDHNEQKRQHYQANKEAINEKKKERFVCECGCLVQKTQTARHRKSAFHLANI